MDCLGDLIVGHVVDGMFRRVYVGMQDQGRNGWDSRKWEEWGWWIPSLTLMPSHLFGKEFQSDDEMC